MSEISDDGAATASDPANANKNENGVGSTQGRNRALLRSWNIATEVPDEFWTVLGAIVWIATRDDHLVARVEAQQEAMSAAIRQTESSETLGISWGKLWRESLPTTLDEPAWEKSGELFRSAKRELLTRLSRGDLKASGRIADSTMRVSISPLEFADAEDIYSSLNGLRLHRHIFRLRLHRTELQKFWRVSKPISRIGAERKAAHWLKKDFAEKPWRRRATLWREARKLFCGLSARGFDRAWKRAVVEFPERKRGGRRAGPSGKNPPP